MIYRIAADGVLLVHLGFILFVVFGGLFALRFRFAPWVHLPAAVWGIGIEMLGGICPLTHLENWLRREAGEVGYAGSFIEHYLLPLIYPAGLTRAMQLWLAGFALIANILIYGIVIARRRSEEAHR